MLKNIQDTIFSSGPFDSLRRYALDIAAGQPIVLHGIAGSLMAFAAAAIFQETGRQVLVVAADEDRADKLRDDAMMLLGDGPIQYFGSRPMHHAQTLDMSSSIAQVETLKALAAGAIKLIVASSCSVIEHVTLPEQFRRTVIELQSGREYNFRALIEKLENAGFERKDFVEGYGDIAVRGGILDVFPYIGENPVRIEFWGDAIESIREFDVLSQRSIRMLETCSIVPDPSGESRRNGEERAADGNVSSVFAYLRDDAILLLDDPALMQREVKELHEEGKQDVFDWPFLVEQTERFARFVHTSIGGNVHGAGGAVLDFSSVSPPSFNGSINFLIETIAGLDSRGMTVYLTCDTAAEARRLNELIGEAATSSSGAGIPRCEILSETIHSGFIFPEAQIAVIPEHEIFGRLKRRGGAKRRRFRGISQKELQQLKPGDFVVHIDHGIGVFDRLTKIKVGGVEQEVMKVLFLENDVLYVNLNTVTRIQKYASQEGHVPKLTRLGSQEWERVKARVKKRIKDIARDLIALYAKRKHEDGFAFSPDTHWQREMEASFMYEDTPDQAQTTTDVKRDMEAPAPMDRLICGDVGFGKTEVAVRAAFKAINDNKQVAVLVPTTILALQHFSTFNDRLGRYGARVENMTRFRARKEQQNIVTGLKGGTVDIVIGTHRILSKDIAFKDLGLLIIDEEHRFGVAAKEKLRKFKATVDTLTLTATPIPRTLHFSLIGARDLSLINTPPRNRLPVTTEIIPADTGGKGNQWRVVREAVIHEIHRGGQVYFVHDRVNNIDAIADQVRRLVPEARVHVAHGQMEGHELEKTMVTFLERQYDVLVCTKIIESGLDIPNVNTIIINRADRFGLAELYQLRGRVGRSNVQAFAYLLTPPLSILPKFSLRRLQAIEEFAELGSGFNLAMRDLEIRGTGNLLGGEQSGFIMEMGFEMYERIVREAVDELKTTEFNEIFKRDASAAIHGDAGAKGGTLAAPEFTAIVDADVEALLPDFYIESSTERLDMYRRLYRTRTVEDVQAIREELRDRFGEYPPEAENLFLLVELRILAARSGFPRVEIRGNELLLTLPEESNVRFYGAPDDADSPFQRLMAVVARSPKGGMRLHPEGKIIKLLVPLKHKDAQKKLLEAKDKIIDLMETV